MNEEEGRKTVQDNLSVRLADTIKWMIGHFDDHWFSVEGKMNAPAYRGGSNGSIFSSESEALHAQHAHGFYELLLIASGVCPLNIGAKMRPLKQGDCCLLLPELPHSEPENCKFDYTAIWITVQNAFVSLHISQNQGNLFRVLDSYRFADDTRYYDETIVRVACEKNQDIPFPVELAKTYVLQMLIRIMRELDPSVLGKDNDVRSSQIADQVVRYADMHRDEDITLRDISQHVGISINLLNTIFKSVMNTTISQYIIEQKMIRVKNMLLDPDKKLSDIACTLGFYDQYHLSKTFKKKTGMSPSEYRRINL